MVKGKICQKDMCDVTKAKVMNLGPPNYVLSSPRPLDLSCPKLNI